MHQGQQDAVAAAGLVYMALSALSFSIMSLLINMLGHGAKGLMKVPSFELAGIRAAVGIVLCVFFVLRAKEESGVFGPRSKRRLLLLRGFIGIFGMYCNWFVASNMPLGEATVLIFTAPLFTCILASLFLGEPFQCVEVLVQS